MYGVLCQKWWTPQPNWPDMFMYGVLCPKWWTLQPNWREMFMYGVYVLSSGHPSLTGVICLCTGFYVQSG